MSYEIEYFHPRILKEIETWPESIKIDYARLIELLMDYGPGHPDKVLNKTD